jgi:ferredoxin
MAKLTHDRSQCIFCGACFSTCPDYFESQDKVVLKGAEYDETDKGVLEINDDQKPTAEEAASVCPVGCIHVED